MKATHFTILLALLIPASTMANGSIVKERAKNLRDSSNARQGVPPAQPTGPAAPAPANRPAPAVIRPTPSAGDEARDRSIQKIQAFLSALKPGPVDSPERKEQLARTLTAAAGGSTKPSAELVEKLASGLIAVFSEMPVSQQATGDLARHVYGALNGARMTQDQAQNLVRDAGALLAGSGVSRERAEAVSASLSSLIEEAKQNALRPPR